jgi:hypothetical protein
MKFTTALVAIFSAASLVAAAPAAGAAIMAEIDPRATSPCPAGKVGLCCKDWTSSQEGVGSCGAPSTAANQDEFRNTCRAGNSAAVEWRAYCCDSPPFITPRGYSATGCWRV